MKRRGEGSESGRKKGLKMCEVNDGINMKMWREMFKNLETNYQFLNGRAEMAVGQSCPL